MSETRYDLVLRAPRAVIGGSERPACVAVTGERIAALSSYDDPPAAERLVELGDDEVLLPGLVDTHVHVNEPGRTEWEGFASATRAAAAGGVTTLIDMPLNSIPPTVTVAALREKQDAARDQVMVDVGFWGGAVPDHLGDLADLHEAGVFGFKCFLADSGVEEFPPLTHDLFVEAMTETTRLGSLFIVHAEDQERLAQAPEAGGLSYDSFLRSRPDGVEQLAVDHVIETARATGGRAHVLHLSSARALPALRRARAEGVDVSVETCPHYLCLSAEEIPDGATEFKCCPPIRDRGNQDLLWDGLRSDDIDVVVSDHSPCTVDLKQLGDGDFGLAWGGIASVQLGLPAVWSEASRRGVGLAQVVGWMATASADRVGLSHKGRIAVGADADLAVFAPDETWQVDPVALRHKNPVSAYGGRHLRGAVRQTWLRGTRLDIDQVSMDQPAGRLLVRGRRGPA